MDQARYIYHLIKQSSDITIAVAIAAVRAITISGAGSHSLLRQVASALRRIILLAATALLPPP